jgi:ATP-dependent Clp protease ATP-binding subunit ClpA
MTTNAGASETSRRSIGFTEQDHASDGMEALKRYFTPEFRNRLDAVVQFTPLSTDTIASVVDKFVFELEQQLAEKKVALTVDADARAWLAERGYDPQMGARPMARLIQNEIKKPLANELLFGALVNGGSVRVYVEGAGLAFAYGDRALH